MSAIANDNIALIGETLAQLGTPQASRQQALNQFGGGGTMPPMDIVDAKVAAAEARTDTKFSELRRDLDKAATKGTVWTAAVTLFTAALGILAFAANRFDAGVSAGGALAPYIQAQQRTDQAQDRKLDEILRRLPPERPPAKK